MHFQKGGYLVESESVNTLKYHKTGEKIGYLIKLEIVLATSFLGGGGSHRAKVYFKSGQWSQQSLEPLV